MKFSIDKHFLFNVYFFLFFIFFAAHSSGNKWIKMLLKYVLYIYIYKCIKYDDVVTFHSINYLANNKIIQFIASIYIFDYKTFEKITFFFWWRKIIHLFNSTFKEQFILHFDPILHTKQDNELFFCMLYKSISTVLYFFKASIAQRCHSITVLMWHVIKVKLNNAWSHKKNKKTMSVHVVCYYVLFQWNDEKVKKKKKTLLLTKLYFHL